MDNRQFIPIISTFKIAALAVLLMLVVSCGSLQYKSYVAIPLNYSDASYFRKSGHALVEDDSGMHWIDTIGCFIPDESVPEHYGRGLSIRYKDGKYGLRDENTGRMVLGPVYDRIISAGNNYFGTKYNGKWGVVDITGRIVIPFKYDLDDDLYEGWLTNSPYCVFNGCLVAILGDKCGLIDTCGNIRIPFESTNMTITGSSVIIEKAPGEFYLSDLNGLWKSGPYESIEQATPILYSVRLNDDCGLLKMYGTVKWLECDDIVSHYYPFIPWLNNMAEDMVAVKKNGKFGFANSEGKIVIPMKFDEVKWFSEGLCVARKGRKYGYIDTDGKFVLLMNDYDELNELHQGYAKVKKADTGYGFIRIIKR